METARSVERQQECGSAVDDCFARARTPIDPGLKHGLPEKMKAYQLRDLWVEACCPDCDSRIGHYRKICLLEMETAKPHLLEVPGAVQRSTMHLFDCRWVMLFGVILMRDGHGCLGTGSMWDYSRR